MLNISAYAMLPTNEPSGLAGGRVTSYPQLALDENFGWVFESTLTTETQTGKPKDASTTYITAQLFSMAGSNNS